MNILYQKAKLLGRPFRNSEEPDGGYGFDTTTITGEDNSSNSSSSDAVDDPETGGSKSWWEDFIADPETGGSRSWWESLTAPDSGSDPEGAGMRAEIDALIKAGVTGGTNLDFLKKLPTKLWDAVKNAFKKEDGSYDFLKLGAAGGALLSMSGLGEARPKGYQGVVPKLTATREQVKYDDPNRRAGAGGRDYFTDTVYSPEKDTAAIDAAKAASKTQREGILAGYTPAAAPTKASTTFARPYEKAAATTGTTAANTKAEPAGNSGIAAALPVIPNALDIAKQTYPEIFEKGDNSPNFVSPRAGNPNAMEIAQQTAQQPIPLAKGGPAMKQPRYLRGITDGMEDKIKTSIDGKQKALLSHGEFVIPADVVSHLGNGNSDSGAKKLYQMMDRIRQARTGTKKQGRQINPDKFMPGGPVGYQSGGIVAFVEGGAIDTTTSSGLAPYAGDYITQTLGEAQAAAAQPYQVYGGPLTAGESDLQKSAFAGVKDMASTGYTPATFTSGTFDTAAANKYMNPYLEASLNPQMKELRRQAQINNMGSLAKAGRAGAMSGDSRNLMESEGIRNLLSKQSDVLGQGYATAYDKAMGQFNTEQGRNMDVQKANEASRVYSADYSKGLLGDMAALGKTQRDIEAEGIAADKTEFEKQRDYDKEMAQYKIGMLQKLPVGSTTTEANTNPITDYLKNSGTIIALFKQMGLIK